MVVEVQDADFDMQAHGFARYSTVTLKSRRDIGDIELSPVVILQRVPGRFAKDQEEVN